MTQKKVLILRGSPRMSGNSNMLAEQVVDGALSSGAQVRNFFLQDMHILPCNACDACQENENNGCILEDDMQMIYPELRAVDSIVISTPIYWFNMSAQIKLCIDRWYALETPKGSALSGKNFAFLMSFGDSDPYTSGAINAIRCFQDICRYLNAQIAGFVYASAMDVGDIKNHVEVIEQAYRLGQKISQ